MFFMFEQELAEIDKKINTTNNRDIPGLFRNIPLDVFGKLLLDVPERFPNIKKFFPAMASDRVQDPWTGSHGESCSPNRLLL
jgi:hypothetical protein